MPIELDIRAEQPADYPTVFKVHELAFDRPDEGHLIDKIRASDKYIPELSVVAVSDGQILGHVIFSKICIDATAGPTKEVLALAPLAVRPEYQSKGVGSALCRYGLDKARELGWDAIIVLGSPTYYPRFGFEPASEFGVESPFPLNDPNAFMVLELRENSLEGYEGMATYPDFFSEFG